MACGVGEGRKRAMAEDAKAVEEERQRLIAARQAWIEALAGEYRRRRTKDAVDRIVQIQHAIEAVTAALEQAGDPAAARERANVRMRTGRRAGHAKRRRGACPGCCAARAQRVVHC